MYAAPVGLAGPGVSRSSATTTLPLIAIACLGLLGFLVAAAIVLALIPIYVPNTSKPATLKQSQTSKITFLLANSPSKRDVGNYTNGVEDLYGATIVASGLPTIASRLLARMSHSKISNCVVKSALLSYQTACSRSGRKKRYSIKKRQTIFCPILIVEYYLLYQFDCLYGCQTAVGPVIQNSLYAIGSTFAPLTNVGFLFPSGATGFRNTLYFQDVYYVDPIVPVHTGLTVDPVAVTLPTVAAPDTTRDMSG